MHASVPDTLINAAHTHAQQGGMSVIFICDDGMQLISEEDRQERRSAGAQERMVFYANHNIRQKASGGTQGRRVRGTLNRDVREVIVDSRVGRGLDGRVEGRVSWYCTMGPMTREMLPTSWRQKNWGCCRMVLAAAKHSRRCCYKIFTRMPSCTDCQDTLYTYRDTGLYTNDGDGAIDTGVCVKEDDVKDWFAGNLNTTQLLEGAEVKTGHTVDWAVRQGGYKKCEGGKDIIIWLCMYEADECILAGKPFTLRLGGTDEHAEAAIHNTYIAKGALRIVRTCLGARCCVKH
ncbi:hypothetical protein B0H10DRAFT_1949465 [Mycena sp. CBHHK59/15]|nr:hypothetical protein B0H10DRAFT_1949465 [Mycena sp. CBHHK59/15]